MAKKKRTSVLQRLDVWHKTKQGYAVFGLIELALSYVFASWAIDNGQLWTYLVAIVLLLGCVQNFFRLGQKVLARG